jgi:hypothetical protein
METPATHAEPQAQASTPGNGQPQGVNPPSTPPANPPAQPEGKVSLDPKEYAQLLRDQARLKSVQRRQKPGAPAHNPDDPSYDPNDAVAQERSRSRDLEQQIFLRDVKDGARELLAKPEYAGIPESTRKVILKNPRAMSEATDLDTVLSDIEDFLGEESAALRAGTPPSPQPPAHQPPGHDTPPKVGTGSPAAPATEQFEDVTHLTGRARSMATFRNTQRRSRGLKE